MKHLAECIANFYVKKILLMLNIKKYMNMEQNLY